MRALPTTIEALKQSRARFCAAKKQKGCDLERGSYLHEGVVHTFKQRIVSKSIAPNKTKGCVYYVTRNYGAGARVAGGKYTVWSLCQGGRIVTGDNGRSSLRAAMEAVGRLANSNRPKAHPRERALLFA